jgi:endonuclease V-like protein UPF0215 family
MFELMEFSQAMINKLSEDQGTPILVIYETENSYAIFNHLKDQNRIEEVLKKVGENYDKVTINKPD